MCAWFYQPLPLPLPQAPQQPPGPIPGVQHNNMRGPAPTNPQPLPPPVDIQGKVVCRGKFDFKSVSTGRGGEEGRGGEGGGIMESSHSVSMTWLEEWCGVRALNAVPVPIFRMTLKTSTSGKVT